METVTKTIVEKVMDGKASERPARIELLRCLASENRLNEAALVTALSPMIEYLEDVALDAPNAET